MPCSAIRRMLALTEIDVFVPLHFDWPPRHEPEELVHRRFNRELPARAVIGYDPGANAEAP